MAKKPTPPVPPPAPAPPRAPRFLSAEPIEPPVAKPPVLGAAPVAVAPVKVSTVPCAMLDVAVSDKDRFIAVAQKNGVVALWQPVMAAKLGITAPIVSCHAHDLARAVAFEPSLPPAPPADYTVFATGGCDGRVRRWQFGDQAQNVVLYRHDSTVMSLAFDRRAAWLVSGSEDRTIAIVRWAERRVEKRFEAHDGTVISVAIAPDGERIASGGADGRAYLWSIAGKRLARLDCDEGAGLVWAVKFLDDDRIIFSQGPDIWLWTKATGATVLYRNPTRITFLPCLAIHPDGSWLVFGQGSHHTWMRIDGKSFRRGSGHRGDVNGLAFLADGRLASVGDDGFLLLFDDSPNIALRLPAAERPTG